MKLNEPWRQRGEREGRPDSLSMEIGTEIRCKEVLWLSGLRHWMRNRGHGFEFLVQTETISTCLPSLRVVDSVYTPSDKMNEEVLVCLAYLLVQPRPLGRKVTMNTISSTNARSKLEDCVAWLFSGKKRFAFYMGKSRIKRWNRQNTKRRNASNVLCEPV